MLDPATPPRPHLATFIGALVCSSLVAISCADLDSRAQELEAPWTRTTIQAGGPVGSDYRGADGLSAVDGDGDGWPDAIAVPWEQSSKVTLSTLAGGVWSTAIIGTNGHAEEAVLADVDRDGRDDVISGGEEKQLRVHFHNPTGTWTSITIATGASSHRWMQIALVDVDADPATVELVAGGKRGSTGDASIRIYSSTTPRVAASWTYREVGPVGWTMSLIPRDVGADEDLDFIVVDKTNFYGMKGARLLENEGGTWTNRPIAVLPGDNNFAHLVDWDDDGDEDLFFGSKLAEGGVMEWVENGGDWRTWTTHPIAYPADVGGYVASTTCDLDDDELFDLVLAFAAASGDLSGVVGLRGPDFTERIEISGPAGEKFDTVSCVRVGELVRVYTTEQVEQLGLIWYER